MNEEHGIVKAKRSSYDETNHHKGRLDAPEEDYKASSLPRGTKIAATSGGSQEKKTDAGDRGVLEEKGWSECVCRGVELRCSLLMTFQLMHTQHSN